ncbi:protein Brevis radix-like 2 [Andrographis paniculata]|uniref:protein Brevis radix-like 2 n=1 Tax=Andrographis paniculata TaxID=175694 RepID=UPI0021E83745|nr:protein Brevis radix-like 2 [Andrographis paniculata]
MLTCIACSKQLNTAGSLQEQPEDEDNAAVSAALTKPSAKSLTSQIKDIAVKASDAYKSCKPCSGSSGRDLGRTYEDSEVGSASERFYGSYRRAGSCNSTPRLWGKDMKAFSSGSATPASVSSRIESVLFLEEDEPKEWIAQVEPGVLITFVSSPRGGNDLKRIQFSREMFNKWQAQRWWAENYDKVMELYNVQRFASHAAPLPNPPRTKNDEDSKIDSAGDSPATPSVDKEHSPRYHHPTGISSPSTDSPEHRQMHSRPNPESGGRNAAPKLSSICAAKTETSSVDASARSSSSAGEEFDHSGELSASNASDLESEWVEQDEPGVYITIRTLPGGARELRRVRFSRERFEEMHARMWWEENRARIQQQYL